MPAREIYVFEFSPDNGNRWFPVCDEGGLRIWSSLPVAPEEAFGWRKTIRQETMLLEMEEFPPGFDSPGIWGSQRREDEQSAWLPNRSEIDIRFSTGNRGFATQVISGRHKCFLRRDACTGEPIWRLIADVMDWYQEALQKIDPRGSLGRKCEVVVGGPLSSTGEFGAMSLGNEFRLWEFLHGWMAKVGHKPWLATS